jgi:L-alanine-DL-glutamate epimerase-like enolase superfamily enzyme
MTRTIDAVDFFFLAMPVIEPVADGSQDALLVRVQAGDAVGWGECESSPLPTIAALVTPMSHSACHPVSASVLGQPIERPEDILRIHQAVRENSLDLLQADHALSGIDVALWDLLGQVRGEPVYRLLGEPRAYPKIPYASVLFGETPAETYTKAKTIRAQGFRAAKFGWGSFGRGSVQEDADLLAAAREGLGAEGILLVDAGTVWGHDVASAQARMDALRAQRVTWLEEPFYTGALEAYQALAGSGGVALAAGEGAHNEDHAQHLIDYGRVGYIQIDTGRIGGITSARRVVLHAQRRGVQYVNHTFTSALALSASLQPYVGIEAFELCEYPTELKPLARDLASAPLLPDADGMLRIPDAPGLGLEPNLETVRRYLQDVEMRVQGRVVYKTPAI